LNKKDLAEKENMNWMGSMMKKPFLELAFACLLLAFPGSQGFQLPSHGRSAKWISSTSNFPVRSARSTLYMGMKVTIRIVGRKTGGEKWLEDACSMYQTRLRPANIDVDTHWHKNNEGLIKGVQGDYTRGVPVVLLDPLGKTRSSETLATDFFDWIEHGGSRLIFVIGGGKW
jgi:hypothetical protein